MNINEIAELAGVSRATVSRYLNDGYVSASKKEAIRKVIEETGYEPSQQAQNLRKKVTKLIGVIIPRLQSESVSKMVEGISSVLSGEDYRLLLANTQNDETEELKYLKIFRKNQVDGIILMGTIFSKEHYRLMAEVEVPLVVLGQQMKDYPCVYQDDYHAAYAATERILEKGKRLAYLGVTTRDRAAGAERQRGFEDAVDAAGGDHTSVPVLEAEFGVSSGYELTEILLNRQPDTDSILCATDSIAVGALKYLQKSGIRVPEDIQLMGFGHNMLATVVDPPITTVNFFYKTTGIEAARLLLDMLHTGEDLKKEVKMGYKIIEQESLR